MKIILLRHGESVDDILDCYGGAADYPLSDSGKKTAEDVAAALNSEPVEKIYSSPLKRAIETAEAVDAQKGCGITTIDTLRERNSYGVLSGCNKAESKEIFGYLLSGLKGKPGDYYSDELVVGAEPKDDFDLRVRDALSRVIQDAQTNNYQMVAVVTHGNVTRSIYKNIFGVSAKIDLDLLSKTIVEYESGNYAILSREGVHEK